jgi:hypothetical protein
MVAGRTFTQATGANQATFSAAHGPMSQPAFTFPGTANRFMDYAGSLSDFTYLHSGVCTVCIAYQEPDTNTSYTSAHVLYATQATSSLTALGVDDRLGNTLAGNGVAGMWNVAAGSFSASAYRWRAFRRLVYPTASGVQTRSSTGVTATNTSYSAAPSATVAPAMRLFSHPGAARQMQFNAAIYEMIFFDYALSDVQLADVSGYFVSRYGVTA